MLSRMQWAMGFSPRHTVDPLQIEEQRVPLRLRRPHMREAPADFGLDRLATKPMNSPGQRASLCPRTVS